MVQSMIQMIQFIIKGLRAVLLGLEVILGDMLFDSQLAQRCGLYSLARSCALGFSLRISFDILGYHSTS